MKLKLLLAMLEGQDPEKEVAFFIDGHKIELDGTWAPDDEKTVYLSDVSGSEIIEELERH